MPTLSEFHLHLETNYPTVGEALGEREGHWQDDSEDVMDRVTPEEEHTSFGRSGPQVWVWLWVWCVGVGWGGGGVPFFPHVVCTRFSVLQGTNPGWGSGNEASCCICTCG